MLKALVRLYWEWQENYHYTNIIHMIDAYHDEGSRFAHDYLKAFNPTYQRHLQAWERAKKALDTGIQVL